VSNAPIVDAGKDGEEQDAEMDTRCLECGSERAGDARECAECGVAIGMRPTDSAVTVTGRHRAELRMDDDGIKVMNTWGSDLVDRVIGWDEVYWLRDGPRFSRYTRWIMEIVLKNGSTIKVEASATGTTSAAPQALQAIRRIASQHAIPAVLTGRPVTRFDPGTGMPEAGLYPDPGGAPGLREWDGTEWSPVLHTDPADIASGGNGELAPTLSPLPKQVRQQHWESAVGALEGQQFMARALAVLTWLVAALLLAGLVVACYWLTPTGAARVLGAAKAAVWAADLFLALCAAGLWRALRRARASVRRHQRIADMAEEAAAVASAHDAQSPPETNWTVSGSNDAELSLDEHDIMLRQRSETRWIGWNDVGWFRDGEYFHLSRRLRKDGWALAIVLKDGSVLVPDATRSPRQAPEETLAAVRQAARQHAIPAVLTGRPVSGAPAPAGRPGFYPDPGGEPGLREWTGTDWLPSLLVDPATSGPNGEAGQDSIVSPLSKDVQQRQWDAAIAAVPRWYRVVLDMLGRTLVATGFGWPFPAILVVGRALAHGGWLGMKPVAAVCLYAVACLWTCAGWAVVLFPVRVRRATVKVARAARAASARAATEAATDAQATASLGEQGLTFLVDRAPAARVGVPVPPASVRAELVPAPMCFAFEAVLGLDGDAARSGQPDERDELPVRPGRRRAFHVDVHVH
jgi:hypothetical protein